MTNDEYCESLTAADWAKAKAIEAEICRALAEGLTESQSMQFVRATMAIQKVLPTATAEGVFDLALREGLSRACERVLGKQGENAGHTSGTILVDGATLVSKPKRAGRGKKGQVRGV